MIWINRSSRLCLSPICLIIVIFYFNKAHTVTRTLDMVMMAQLLSSAATAAALSIYMICINCINVRPTFMASFYLMTRTWKQNRNSIYGNACFV